MEERGIIPVKKHFFTNIKEWIQSKINKNYILTSNSPDSLLKNDKLIIRTLQRNPSFLDSLSDEKIFKNDIFLKTAFENGYSLYTSDRFRENVNFLLKYMDITGEVPSIQAIKQNVFDDSRVSEKFLKIAKEQQYIIPKNAPEFLREDKELALTYYKNLLSKNKNIDNLEKLIKEESILTGKSISDIDFMNQFINLCDTHNVDKQKLLEIVLDTSEVDIHLKENPQAINMIFNSLKPENINMFFEKLQLTDEEIEVFFNNDFTENLEELGKVYKKNPIAINDMNGGLLGRGIPIFKLQEYAGDKKFQQKLLDLSPFKYKLFEKISNGNLSKTDRWHRLDAYTLENLWDGYYEELLNDILTEAQNGNKITEEELDTLANLFSAQVTGPQDCIENLKVQPDLNNNNIFNITSKEELKYYDKIRETICDIIIINPELEPNIQTEKFNKYLKRFKSLDSINRVKLAVIEKAFGTNLRDADQILQKFGEGVNGLTTDNEKDKDVIEQIKAICNILNCTDIEILQEVGKSIDFINLDLSRAAILLEDGKEIFEKDIKKDLYSPREEDFIGLYEDIYIYKAPVEFEIMTKWFGGREANKKIWEKSYGHQLNDSNKNIFRRNTCISYTNGELLNPTRDGFITFGFGKTIEKFKFVAMYKRDGGSDMFDHIYEERGNAKYTDKEDFVTQTPQNYNEIIVDTLVKDDSSDDNKKLMPEYMIYYQKATDMTQEERNNDINWKNSIKAAKEFGIPIVIIDCEEIRKNEFEKIKKGIEQNNSDYKSVKKLVGQINHYKFRYCEGRANMMVPEILELISDKELKKKEAFLEENKHKNQFELPKDAPIDLETKINENSEFLQGVEIFER